MVLEQIYSAEFLKENPKYEKLWKTENIKPNAVQQL